MATIGEIAARQRKQADAHFASTAEDRAKRDARAAAAAYDAKRAQAVYPAVKTTSRGGGFGGSRGGSTVYGGRGGWTDTPDFSAGKLAAGVAEKGIQSAFQGLSSTGALVEQTVLKPVEWLTGDDQLSQRAPLHLVNEWAKGEQAKTSDFYQKNVDAGGTAARLADKYGSATVAAVPQAALAVLTGGSSVAGQGIETAGAAAQSGGILQTAQRIAGAMARDKNYWLSFSQVTGNSYEQAKADGASDAKATLYALGNGLANAAVEVGGGIQTLPGELQSGGSALRAWVDSMVDEGKGEVVQGVLERGLQNVFYNKGNALASATDENAVFNPKTAAGEFAGGAVVGGILGGGQMLASRGGDAQEAPGKRADLMEQEAARLFGGRGNGDVSAVTENETAAPAMGTAVNENGLGAFTEQEKINLSSGSKNKVISTFQDAVTFVRNALSNRQISERAYMGRIPDAVAKKVLHDTGMDISGYHAILPSDNVRHIIKNHGDVLTETARGQPAVTVNDIALIPQVLASPDKVRLSQDTDSRGRSIIVFEKQIGENYVTMQAISDGTHSIQTDTLYKQKGKNPQVTEYYDAGDIPSPAHNAQSVPPQGSSFINSTISQGAENVKPGGADILLDILPGGKRVEQSSLTPEQFDAAAERGYAMDADGNVYYPNPADHIDRRSVDSVSSRSVNAFQFDHPELHGYFQQAARSLMADAELSAAFPAVRRSEATTQGKRYIQSIVETPSLRKAMDAGLSRPDIVKAAQALIEDHGQENYAAAKRLEIVLDEMLTDGYTTVAGDVVEPNKEYIRTKSDIAGAVERQALGGYIPEELDAVPDGDTPGDAVAGFDPYSHLQNQNDVFHPEGAYAARPVDVPTKNFDGSSIPKAASTVMGAQGIDESDVRFLERQIADGALSFDTITDESAVSAAQMAVQEKGFDGALEKYRQAVAAGVATKDNTALGQQLLLQAMREGNTAHTAELLSLYTRNSTTAAQAMQAQSIFRKLSPQGQLVAVQKAVDALNAKHGTNVQLDEADVQDFLNADSENARQQARDAMLDKAAAAVPGTFKAKFDTIRYLAMLGNPRTHVRNILGNTLFQVPVAVKNRVGALAEGAAHLASSGKTERTKALLGTNPFGALARDARDDFANVKDFLGSINKYAEGDASLGGIEARADAFSNGNVLGRSVNRLSNANAAMLEAEDTSAKKWIYTQSLAGYLKANGCHSMADADAALLNRARTYAADEAMRNTFNDRNAFSDFVSSAGRLSRSKNPFTKKAGYVVEGVLPFKRTPANIAARAVEYSPVGTMLGALDIVRGARSGDMGQVAKGLDRAAAGVSGGALMAAGFLAAGAGYITGGADEDKDQADFDDLTGHQTYALELKNGTSVTLDWLAPEAIPFFMGAELYNQSLSGGKLSFWETLEAAQNASAPMLEMSMLQGLSDTFDSAAYAVNRGDSVIGSLVASALTNYLTQAVPTLGGQVERIGEDVRMSPYTDKNSDLPTGLQYTIGKVSQKVPGWDYQQVPYVDAWGREEETGGVLERAASNLFNPAYVSQVDVDKVEAELQRVKNATGDGSVFPARAERSIEYTPDGKESVRHDLTAAEYVKYAKRLGQERYAIIKQGMATQGYKQMSDADRAAYFDSLYSYAAQTAKAAMYSDYPVQAKYTNAKNAKHTLGVSTAEYLALYDQYGSDIMGGKAYSTTVEAVKKGGMTVEEYAGYKDSVKGLSADKDSNGESISGTKKQKVISAIAALDLSPTEKDWLYLLNYDGKNAQKDLQETPWH